jgi:hypothetical protein
MMLEWWAMPSLVADIEVVSHNPINYQLRPFLPVGFARHAI